MSIAEQEERIAMLLSSLGNEVADHVMQDLPDDTAARVQRMLDEFADAPLESDEVEDVLDEFLRFFRFAVQNDNQVPSSDGEKPSAKTNKKPANEPELKAKPFEPTGDPFVDLKQLQPFQLGGGLRGENERTIAVVLNCVDPDVAGMAMEFLPEEMRSKVFLSMRNPPKMPAPLLERIIATTVEKSASVQPSDVLDPAVEANKKLAELLRAMEQRQRADLLRALEDADPEGAEELKKLLYSFDDLVNVSDRSIQRILGDIASATLALALKDAEPAVNDRIMSNLSKRARATIEEEIEFLGRIKPEEQAQARAAICETMAKLDETGDLEMES